MYKATEVERKYGFDPRSFDLSRIPDWNRFVEAMNYAMMKQFCALEKGGRMAAFLLNRIRRIKRGSLLAKENHVPHPKGAQGEVGDENLF